MKIKHIVIFITFTFISCNQDPYFTKKIEGKQININKTIHPDSTLENFITPYRIHINASLDSVLAYTLML